MRFLSSWTLAKLSSSIAGDISNLPLSQCVRSDLGPVSHGRTVSFTGIRLLVFGYYEYQYLYASNRFNFKCFAKSEYSVIVITELTGGHLR
jgi:hypothetical protein